MIPYRDSIHAPAPMLVTDRFFRRQARAARDDFWRREMAHNRPLPRRRLLAVAIALTFAALMFLLTLRLG